MVAYRIIFFLMLAELAAPTFRSDVCGQTITEVCSGHGAGGGVASGGLYSLTDTIGQPCIGWISASNVTFAGGLWYSLNISELDPMSNHPPMAQTITVTRLPGASIKIRLPTLAVNWSDPDAHTIEFVTANALSTNGVPIYFDGSILLYANGTNQNHNVIDAFTYTIRDMTPPDLTPLTNNGTILIKVERPGGASFNIVSTSRTSDGKVKITGSGIPGQAYQLQRTLYLTEPVVWVTLTNSANGTTYFVSGPNGLFTYVDPDSNQFAQCYYRTALP